MTHKFSRISAIFTAFLCFFASICAKEVNPDLLKPDFAFPQDVLKTANAFLEEKIQNDSKHNPGLKILAVENRSIATLNIDEQDLQSVVHDILAISDGVKDDASRAMLYTYAAFLARQYDDVHIVNDEDDGSFVSQSDSLFNLAYKSAPDDALLKPFDVALTAYDSRIGMVRTVKEFVLCIWTDYFSQINPMAETIIEDLPEGNPLRNYYVVKEMTTQEKAIEYLSRNLDKPGIEYGLFAELEHFSIYYGIDSHLASYNTFFEAIKQRNFPKWLDELVDYRLSQIKTTRGKIELPFYVVPDKPFEAEIISQNTDSVTLNFYRYLNRDEFEKGLKLKNKRPDYTLLKTINSGFEADTTVVTLTFPAGYYVLETSDVKLESPRMLMVTPWNVSFVNTPGNERIVQVLDIISGKGVKGLEIQAVGIDKEKRFKEITDNNGIAVFKTPIRSQVVVKEPDARLALDFDTGLPYWDWSMDELNRVEKTDNYVKISGITDRTAYKPGDTIHFALVAYNNSETVANLNYDAEVISQEANSYKQNILTSIELDPTDKFGRTGFSYTLPNDVPPGRGAVNVNGEYFQFQISDFKLPDLQIKDIDYELKGDSVRIFGYIYNSVDAPRAGVDVILRAEEYSSNPLRKETVSDKNGRFEFDIARKLDIYSDSDYYPTNQSFTIEAQSSDGFNAQSSSSYPVTNDVDVSVKIASVIDITEGLTFQIEAKRLGFSTDTIPVECEWKLARYESKDNPEELNEINFRVVTDDYRPYKSNETTTIVLSGRAPSGTVMLPRTKTDTLTPGQYSLTVKASGLPSGTSTQKTIIYNPSSDILPFEQPLFIPAKELTSDNEESATLKIGVAEDNTIVWWCANDDNFTKKDIRFTTLNKGYSDIKIDIKDTKQINFWTIKNGFSNKTSVNVVKNTAKPVLNITLEEFRDKVISGDNVKMRLLTRVGDRPVGAAAIVDVFDYRLRKISAPSTLYLYKPAPISFVSFQDLGISNSYFQEERFTNPKNKILKYTLPPFKPEWKYGEYLPYGYVKYSQSVKYSRAESAALYRSDPIDAMPASALASNWMYTDDAEEETITEGAMAGEAETSDTPTDTLPIRENTEYVAYFNSSLTTSSETGTADIDIMLPNQTSTWEMNIYAWTHDLEFTRQTKTFTATKPIYLAPNPPRFVRVGDRLSIVTVVTNETDSLQNINFEMEMNGATTKSRFDIAARSSHSVSCAIDVDGEVALNENLVITFRADNGKYGDAERISIPILPSTALLVETIPFYVKPSENSISVIVPGSEYTSDNELHYTVNPTWIIVEALSKLLDDTTETLPLSTSYAQLLYISKSATKIVTDHPEAQELISVSQAKRLGDMAIKNLKTLQMSDGGFKWVKWSTESSVYTTLSVLNWLDQDNEDSDIQRMTEKALRYIDERIVAKNTQPGINLIYASTRAAYGKPYTLDGQAVIDKTINYVLKNWRTFSLSDKCLAAKLLERNNYKSVANQILLSLTQHGKETATGFTLPNLTGTIPYAQMLNAFNSVDSTNPAVDQIRSGLINRRRGLTWGDNASSVYITRALIESGTDWLTPSEQVVIKLNGQPIEIPGRTSATGSFAVPVSPGTVTIERNENVPAFGAIVSHRVEPLSAVDAYGTPQLSITKSIYSKDNQKPVRDITLKPGMRLTVSFTITADADMSDVIVVDNRSTAFEPVVQTGSYSYSNTHTLCYQQNGGNTTNLFIPYIRRGKNIVEYDVIVNNAGTFATGVATVTSGLDSDLTAHSASNIITIESEL